MHESILVYRKHRYLKWTLALLGVASALYILHSPIEKPNGGTWLGYTLGVIAAGIMVWLTWFGVRKRSYRSTSTRLEDWASAHVYLGLSLIVIATLHSGFQFGLNIHTALYALMMIVIVSGMFGLYFYIRYPSLIAQNRRGMTTESMLAQIADLDRELRGQSMALDDETARAVADAVHKTEVGGGLWRKLAGRDPDCPTTRARALLEQGAAGELQDTRRQILSRLTKKEDLLSRLRRDIQLRSYLQIWLYVHVPFTLGALAALVAHIVTVFYYW